MTNLWTRERLALLRAGMVHAVLHHASRSGVPPDFLEWADEAERVLLAARRRDAYARRRRVA